MFLVMLLHKSLVMTVPVGPMSASETHKKVKDINNKNGKKSVSFSVLREEHSIN